jgi:hypothetical protein
MTDTYKSILEHLDVIQHALDDFNIQAHLKKFKNQTYYLKLEDSFNDFSHYVREAVENARLAINSPIYVGVIGHYSHGKSSLLNALLFPPKAPELLPTGESIVTSLCSLIQFAEQGDSNEFYQHLKTGEEKLLSEEEYRAQVSGKRTGVLQDLHHFRLCLGARQLSSKVFESMGGKNIELLDTPGLGGPYWKDEAALQQWVQEFMLLIVCVRADQINARTAATINPFLKQTGRPAIPVITFWDMWPETESYKGISDEFNARQKAMDDLKKHFPTLADAADEGRVLFVSARNYRQQVQVPSELAGHTTSDWNIDNVRNVLASYVTDKMAILQSIRSKQSSLDRTRKELVLQACRVLDGKFNTFRTHLSKAISDSKPRSEWEEAFEEGCTVVNDKIKGDFDRIVDHVESIISDAVSAVPVQGNKWLMALPEIDKTATRDYEEQIAGGFGDRIKRQLDRSIVRPLERYIEDSTPLDKNGKRRLTEDIVVITRS